MFIQMPLVARSHPRPATKVEDITLTYDRLTHLVMGPAIDIRLSFTDIVGRPPGR